MLYVEDHTVLNGKNELLEIINSLISSSEVPGLYAQEEIERLFTDPEEVRRQYYGKTLYQAFVERIKQNLKIIVALDFSHE